MTMTSNLTFRHKSTTVAYQKQIRDQRAANYAGPKFWENLNLNLSAARVKLVSREIAAAQIRPGGFIHTVHNHA